MGVKLSGQPATLSEAQFLRIYSTIGSHVDGLFVWLASVATRFHINFVHQNGIWSSCGSEVPDLRDAMVMHVEGHFISTPSTLEKVSKAEVRDGFLDLLDTMPSFEHYPVVLTRPVRSLQQRCDEIGLTPRGKPCLIQSLLAELSGLNPIQYRIHLVSWMQVVQSTQY